MRDGAQVRVSAFLRQWCFVTLAVMGAALVLPASAQTSSGPEVPNTDITGSDSQIPSTGTTGSGSQNSSTRAIGAETQPQSQDASSTPANDANPASTTEAQKAATPHILIAVNKPTQTMTVTVDGHVRYRWRVSTGATHYST